MNRRHFFATMVSGVAVGVAAPMRLLGESVTKLKKPLKEWRTAPLACGVRRAVRGSDRAATQQPLER